MKGVSRRQLYAEDTREAILNSAQALFCRDSFAGTSIDTIAAQAQVTKGAIYHHFKDKRAVFEACFERQACQVSETIATAPNGDNDWQTAFNQCHAFLNFILAHGSNTIPLQEVITVLGWEQWQKIDSSHTIRHIENIVSQLQNSGQMKPYSTNVAVSLIYGLLVGAVMTLSTQPNVKQTTKDLDSMIKDMLLGLKAI